MGSLSCSLEVAEKQIEVDHINLQDFSGSLGKVFPNTQGLCSNPLDQPEPHGSACWSRTNCWQLCCFSVFST